MPQEQMTHEQMSELDMIHKSYMSCALWSSLDEDGRPLDATYTIADITPGTQAAMRHDVHDFVSALDDSGIDWRSYITPEQLGYDFWLTRNGHGAGFWDRRYDPQAYLGELLTARAEAYGEVELYVNEDGTIYAGMA